MEVADWIANWSVPVFVAAILVVALVKKVPIFDEFVAGAGDGIRTTFKVLPSLVALLTAVSMLQASGLLDLATAALSPVLAKAGFPAEVLPMALMRPISGSGSLAVLEQVYTKCGPDSPAGLVASVLQSSTETTFYTIAVYFGAVGIKRTRHTLAASAMGDLSGIVLSALAVRLLLL